MVEEGAARKSRRIRYTSRMKAGQEKKKKYNGWIKKVGEEAKWVK